LGVRFYGDGTGVAIGRRGLLEMAEAISSKKNH